MSAPSFARLLMVELWLSFLFGSYNGAMVPFLTEIMPAERAGVRVLDRLQPRDGCLRRLHAGDLHLADPRNRKPRGARIVVIVRGRAGTGGGVPDPQIHERFCGTGILPRPEPAERACREERVGRLTGGDQVVAGAVLDNVRA